MAARRWPVITIALIAINVAAFLFTHDTIEEQAVQLREVKTHLLILVAMHPELTLPRDAQQFANTFRDHHPQLWAEIQRPDRKVEDSWDAQIRQTEEPEDLQREMDVLASRYSQLVSSSIAEQYAFVPAHPNSIAYLTATFLHGGWMHLIGNMWFLWLAGFVLEDVWGRSLYTIFYLVAGAAALQFHAWTNQGSITATLGASGAVAALMGAFLVRFPTMKIEMAWLFLFRIYRFKAAAYWLLPLWLLMEVFYGTLFGQTTGVAHWAHVGGFLFGALAAVAIRHSGVEQKVDEAIEAEIGLQSDPEVIEATDLIDKNELDPATSVLKSYLGKKPDSIDGWNLLQQVYLRKDDRPGYFESVTTLCRLYLKAREHHAAWQTYEDFLKAGGERMPVAIWFDLCRVAEEQQNFERALSEYQKLAAAYPAERQSLLAQLAAARICLKRLNRPEEALKFYETASASAIPHLDWDQVIQSGIRDAKAVLATVAVPSASFHV